MIRQQHIQAYPDFPWLDGSDPAGVQQFVIQRGWLERGERFVGCEKAGEGNMNLTLRVRTDRRTVILKQARPWVEKYDHIPAPWDRAVHEQRFYERAGSIPAVASRMPRLLRADEAARALLLEDVEGASDLTGLYSGGELEGTTRRSLAAYLAALHGATAGEPDPAFANRAMRELNHQHIFDVPLRADNGLELERFEPGLTDAAAALREDGAYVERVRQTGERYLADGPCLVHGDYFPGSWLRSPRGVFVIDPEFCFYGDAAFDVGFALGHLALSRQPREAAEAFVAEYEAGRGREGEPLADEWVGRYAAVEVMRRLIGVAQLPIPPSEGRRGELLERSRRAMLEGSPWPLWEGGA